MAISEVNDNNFQEQVLKSEAPVLVDFWAPWCGPCKMAEPVLAELAEGYKDKVIFSKINVDENSQTSQNYNVESIPTAILFKEGKEIGRHIGFAGKEAYEELIKKGI